MSFKSGWGNGVYAWPVDSNGFECNCVRMLVEDSGTLGDCILFIHTVSLYNDSQERSISYTLESAFMVSA